MSALVHNAATEGTEGALARASAAMRAARAAYDRSRSAKRSRAFFEAEVDFQNALDLHLAAVAAEGAARQAARTAERRAAISAARAARKAAQPNLI